MYKKKKKNNRILIFELNWMGDILFSFPFLKAIRQKNPNAYITCVVVPQYADLLINVPWIDNIHILSDKNKLKFLKEKIDFIGLIKKEQYDVCYFLKPSRIKSILSFFAGIKERIAFSGKKAFITKVVNVPENSVHRANRILSLAEKIDIKQRDMVYEYFLSKKDDMAIEIILKELGIGNFSIIALNPGGNWDSKRWKREKHIELATIILKKFSNIEIVITGAKKDMVLAENIVKKVDNKRCYSIAGKTTINELAAFFKKCLVVISADSGPLHLASSVGTTTIGLFGPTSFDITGQIGKGKNFYIQKKVDCQIPCYEQECKKQYMCMQLITVKDVFEKVEEIIRII